MSTLTHAIVECPHADRCAGCELIGHDYTEQLRRKGQRIDNALQDYVALRHKPRARNADAELVSSVVPAPSNTHYRTRTKLMVDGLGNIGLHARVSDTEDSHTLVDIPHCQVMPALTNATVSALRPMLKGSGVEAIDIRQVHDGARDGLLITLIAGAASVAKARVLSDQVAALPHVLGVAVSARDRGAVQMLGRDLEVRHGAGYAIDRTHADAPFVHASHGSFVQAHRAQALALQTHVIEQLRRTLGELSLTRIVELHCGEGALGLQLARRGAAMLMVDAFEPAIARLRDAASDQDLEIEAWARDATDAVTRLIEAREPIDAVILDPPRRGVPALLRRALTELSPKAIVYVSCGPESFARDLSHFSVLGYTAERVTPFDLIPLSAEVECVALLRPTQSAALDVLYEDEQVAVVNKPPHVPTTPQSEYAVSLLSIARKQLQAPNLTAVHRLDAGTSGAVILAKQTAHVHAWSQALSQGEKRYRALVRGITRDKGSINRALRDGPRTLDARTRYSRDEVIGGHSLITAMPDEGRTHQIRRHLSSLKHPLLGDTRYGDPKSNRYLEHKHGLDRPFLHCASITLIAPTTGQEITLQAPLAPDLSAVLRSMQSTSAARGDD